jgi:FimV-like protein
MNRGVNGLISLVILVFFASSALAQAVYGPTKAREDLWHVASHIQKAHPKTTVQQWMVGLYQSNTEAFSRSNMNGLMAGVTLQLPQLSQVVSLQQNTAVKVLAQHNRAWRRGSGAVAISGGRDSIKVGNIGIRAHLASMDQQISSLSQAFTSLQQHLNGQYADLSSESLQLQRQLGLLRNNMVALNMDVAPFPANDDPMSFASLWSHTKSQWFAPSSLKVASVAAFLLLLLMVWILWSPRTEPICIKENAEDDLDLGDEYDFMSSAEGIPAKLDLARAYMDMDDMDSARGVLQEVMRECSEQNYQAQAKYMLGQISADKHSD